MNEKTSTASSKIEVFECLLVAEGGLSVRIVARWVCDTERMVQDTCSHLLPSEKDVIKGFYDQMASKKGGGSAIDDGDSED